MQPISISSGKEDPTICGSYEQERIDSIAENKRRLEELFGHQSPLKCVYCVIMLESYILVSCRVLVFITLHDCLFLIIMCWIEDILISLCFLANSSVNHLEVLK